MPGILYHLTFAEEVYKSLGKKLKIDKIDFMAGNLIPDLAIDKKKSHYRTKASVEGFVVPELETAKKELFVKEDSIKLGMYSHLYLDYYFIESFLIPEFIWDFKNKKVVNPRNNKEWDEKTFFSKSGIYDAYTEINHLIIKNALVSKDALDSIPEILPSTQIEFFDTRREKTWKEELNEYLIQEKKYTGDIFNYNRLISFIQKCADSFTKEVLK